MWQTILTTLGGTAVLCAAVAWLIRSITTHILNRDIEKFKSELKMEVYRNETKFSHLHARRGDVIVELHNKLQDFYFALESYTAEIEMSTEASKKEKFQEVVKTNSDLMAYFFHNRIFLTEKMDKTLTFISREMRTATRDFQRMLAKANSEDSGEITDRVREIIKPMLSELRADFRHMLGVEKENRS